MSPFLQLQNVTKSFDAVSGAPPVPVLRGVSMDVQKGESLAIVGPSGSGKSTLLNIIGALDRPTSGSVLLEGEDLAKFDELRLAQFRNRSIGFVFQAHHLLPQCTALENVLIPTLAFPHPDNAAAPARARKLLDRVGLGARLEHRPGQLSGGERQRVALVRALINQPRLLLADEPTGALDQAAGDSLTRLLLELNQETQTTLLVVTHSATVATQMRRTLRLRDGQWEQ